MKIAGLDIGTTGCKCTVFETNGKQLGKAYRDYPVKRRVGGHEIDASALLESVFEVIEEMASKYPDIGGIGVTSFGETFVCTDEDGNPLAPAMLYTDPRGKDECRWLVENLGEKHIAQITGVTAHEMYSLPKILWVKNNKPEIFAKTKHIFEIVDFVVFTLTGNAVIDYSLATRSMAFDINKLDWSDEILDFAGIDRKLLSKPVPTGTDAGAVKESVAEKTGLARTTRIIAVSQDQVSAAVGAGAFDESTGVDGAGTVQCLTPIYDSIPDVEKMMPGKYVIVPYVVPGKYVTYAFSYTGGALIQWCADNLAKKEKELAAEKGLRVYELLEQQYGEERKSDGLDPDGPSGMLVLPHFAGAATPYMDTGSKGAIVGMTMATTPADLYRACIEGVCYEMYLNFTNVKKAGANPEKLHATGGGARSPVWMQMKADVLGIPIVALKTVDAGTVGSAMLTGIALGIFRNLEDAANTMVEKTVTYEPRPEYHKKYMEVYKKYEKLYNAVRNLV